jgi:hypothetical protein
MFNNTIKVIQKQKEIRSDNGASRPTTSSEVSSTIPVSFKYVCPSQISENSSYCDYKSNDFWDYLIHKKFNHTILMDN